MWKIYYDGGLTFSSDEGSPWEAPSRGVLVIVVEDGMCRWRKVYSADYYTWDDRVGWLGRDIFGLFDQLCEPYPSAVKFGRTVPHDEWSALNRQINAEWEERSTVPPLKAERR